MNTTSRAHILGGKKGGGRGWEGKLRCHKKCKRCIKTRPSPSSDLYIIQKVKNGCQSTFTSAVINFKKKSIVRESERERKYRKKIQLIFREHTLITVRNTSLHLFFFVFENNVKF